MRRVAVIGAGLGGLSVAGRLARAGWRVDVFEAQSGPGGKAFTNTIAGYRFDTGPSLVTMPAVFAQLFEELGERLEEHLRFLPLEVICRYVFADGTVLAAWSDRERFAQEVAEKTADSAETVLHYLDYCRRIYDRTAFLFLWKSLHEPASYLDRRAAVTLLRIRSLDALRTMDQANRAFFRDPRTVQLFNRYATYNGSSPFHAPATLNIIPYVEHGIGGYAVEGGIYQVPLALEEAARKKGATFHYGTAVEKILTDGHRVRGVQVGGERLDYPVVVSNADVRVTYELLGDTGARLARRYARLEPSSSGLVFYWGMARAFPDLQVNNIFFSADYPEEFADLFDRRRCPIDPTVYVNITSKVTPQDAPPGCENWFVLINAPPDAGQDWKRQAAAVRERVIARVARALGRSVASDIACEDLMTPADIERRTGSRHGSLYGIASNTRGAAFLRHPNRCPHYGGLYLCGGSAHPGGGMPLAVLSGKVAADLVRKYEGE